MKHYAKAIAIATATLAMSAAAHAGDFYGIASVGSTMPADSIKTDLDSSLRSVGLRNFSSSVSNGTGFRLGAGYQLTSTLAVEVSYLNMGKFDLAISAPGVTITGDASVTGTNVALIGKIPLSDQFSIFGKAGYTAAKASVTARGAGTSSSATNDSNSGGLGFGGIYKLSDSLSLRGEWEKLYSDVSMVSATLQFSF